MSRRQLNEAFRQLALDLDAVEHDDPALERFVVRRGPHRVSLELDASAATLDIEVLGPARVTRPVVEVRRRSALDRLGQALGVDARQLDDDAFNQRYELQERDDSSVAAAGIALFARAEARAALAAVDDAGALPLLIDDARVAARLSELRREDLDAAVVQRRIDALCALAASLLGAPDADVNADARGEGAHAPAPRLRAPVVDARGRKRINRDGTETRRQELARYLDVSPVLALPVCVLGFLPWIALPGYAVDRHLAALPALFALLFAAVASSSVALLRGQPSALSRALARGLGVGLMGAVLLFDGLHAVNRLADRAMVAREDVIVMEVDAPKGRGSGSATFHRRGSDEALTIGSGWFATPGKPMPLVIHPGALGWRWATRR